MPREEEEGGGGEVWSEVGLRIVGLTLRPSSPPPPVAPGPPAGEDMPAPAGGGEAGGSEDEAGRHRKILLDAIQDFATHWKVTPHVFFMLGKDTVPRRYGT